MGGTAGTGIGGNTRGLGGTGGGGNGGLSNTNGDSAVINTGSGGGGSGDALNSGAGGSGIVILRYPDTYSITVGAGLNTGVLNQAVGVAEKYTTFTAGKGTITFS